MCEIVRECVNVIAKQKPQSLGKVRQCLLILRRKLKHKQEKDSSKNKSEQEGKSNRAMISNDVTVFERNFQQHHLIPFSNVK